MEEEHHREIEKAHFWRQPVRWSDHLYEQDRCALIHGFAAVLQDFRCRCVVPIVNYELQDVRVPTRWHGLEKVARDLVRTTCTNKAVERVLSVPITSEMSYRTPET